MSIEKTKHSISPDSSGIEYGLDKMETKHSTPRGSSVSWSANILYTYDASGIERFLVITNEKMLRSPKL